MDMRITARRYFFALMAASGLIYSCATRSVREFYPEKDAPPLRVAPSPPAELRRPSPAAPGPETVVVPEQPEPVPESPALVPALAPVPERLFPEPVIPYTILGSGKIQAETLASFLLRANPMVDSQFVDDLARLYTEEAAPEGINHDIAFAQMCLETGFLRYGGLVTADMNNFCGLGSIGPGEQGEWFPSPRIGVRAHIQHLKAYASEEPLQQDLVDPRYYYVRAGSAIAIDDLAGTWAADKEYGTKIKNILDRLYLFSLERD